MPRPLIWLALAAIPATLHAQDAERLSLSGDAAAVYNLAGTVRIERGTGENVIVEVQRAGADAGELQLERRDVQGRSALVVRYPDRDVIYRRERWNGTATMSVNDDGTFGSGRGGNRIRIRSSGNGTEAHADLRVLVPEGKSVAIRLGVGDVTATNVAGSLDIDVASAGVRTSGTRGRLNIDTGSGSVTVRDAEGDVSIDTGSGSVTIENVRGNDLEVDTGSGSVDGSGLTARSITIDTGSGGIDLLEVSANDIELDTGSGSVELDLRTDVENVRIDTGSGGVRLTIPANLGAELVAESGSGGVQVDGDFTVRRRSRNSMTGQLGDGRGHIEIDTGSGGIRIRSR